MSIHAMTKSFLATSTLCLGLLTTAHATQPLVVYSAIGYDAKICDAFQKATGIPVKLVDGSTGPLLARVQAEKQNAQWSIIWVDGAVGMHNLATQGLLKPFAPKADWNEIGRKVQPSDHAYVTTAVSLAGAMVVNTKALPKNQWPHTWNDLLDPRFKGKVGMNNPAVSGPTYPLVAGMMQWQDGEAEGKSWFMRLKGNGLHIFSTNDDTLRALRYKQISVAIVQNSAGIGLRRQGMPFELVYPNPATLLPRTIAISANATPEVQAEAERFIEFLLSKQGQAVALKGDPNGDSDFNPVVRGVNPNNGVPPIDAAAVQTVNPAIWGPREAEVTSWFTYHIVH